MLSGVVRARLADDPTLGAGNYLQFLRKVLTGSQKVIWCAPDFHAPDGTAPTVLTLDRLNEIVETYAGWYHRHGVRPRDPIVVYTDSALEYVVNFLALSGLGAVPALVNSNLSAEVTRDYAQRLGAVGAFTDAAHRAALRGPETSELIFHVTSADITPADRAGLPTSYPYQHGNGDPVLITHSSGTTGTPKAVCATHQSFFAATRYRLSLPLPQGFERILSALPGSHNSAITVVMQSLLSGLPLHILSSQTGENVLEAIEKFRPTMVAAFASIYADLATRDLSGRDLFSVVYWYNSGDAAHHAHIRVLTRLGHHVEVTAEGRVRMPGSFFHDGLGSSEMGHSLFYNIHKPDVIKRLRCIGIPYGFVEAVVLSEEGEPLPPYQIGRLGVKSPTISPGYWNDSLTTYRSWLRGYWLTGDLVYCDERGAFFHVDRVTDTIRTPDGQMYSVWAEELLLDAFSEVLDCTIFGVTSTQGTTDAYVLLQLRDTIDTVPEDAWRSRANKLLTSNGMPGVTRVFTADGSDLPVGPTGKVQKRQLRARYQQLVREGGAT